MKWLKYSRVWWNDFQITFFYYQNLNIEEVQIILIWILTSSYPFKNYYYYKNILVINILFITNCNKFNLVTLPFKKYSYLIHIFFFSLSKSIILVNQKPLSLHKLGQSARGICTWFLFFIFSNGQVDLILICWPARWEKVK